MEQDELLAKSQEASAFLKLIANPNRLAILCTLQDRQVNVSDLAAQTGMPQAAMSTQLALLREAGLVDCDIQHRQRLYYIADPRVGQLIAVLHELFCAPQGDDKLSS